MYVCFHKARSRHDPNEVEVRHAEREVRGSLAWRTYDLENMVEEYITC